MKFSSQEEYGLRCALQLALHQERGGLTIHELAAKEGLSDAHVAKLMRILRQGGIVDSVRGPAGGYTLTAPAKSVPVSNVLAALGDRIFQPGFCDEHSGTGDCCVHLTNCSIRSLLQKVQHSIDGILTTTTLADLVAGIPKPVSKTTDEAEVVS